MLIVFISSFTCADESALASSYTETEKPEAVLVPLFLTVNATVTESFSTKYFLSHDNSLTERLIFFGSILLAIPGVAISLELQEVQLVSEVLNESAKRLSSEYPFFPPIAGV